MVIMAKGPSISHIAKLKKLKGYIDNFLPKGVICVDDSEELSIVFKDAPITTGKLKLLRKK